MDISSYLLGKKSGGGSGTSDYSQLTNKPTINGVTLNGDLTSSDLKISNAEITIDMQKALTQDLLDEVSAFITQNVDKVVCVKVVDGTMFVSDGYLYIKNTYTALTPVVKYMTKFGLSLQTARIEGTWSQNVFTASVIRYYVLPSETALSTTNLSAYNPTQNYHPATKKYVDDLVGNISTVLESLVTVGGGN